MMPSTSADYVNKTDINGKSNLLANIYFHCIQVSDHKH